MRYKNKRTKKGYRYIYYKKSKIAGDLSQAGSYINGLIQEKINMMKNWLKTQNM